MKIVPVAKEQISIFAGYYEVSTKKRKFMHIRSLRLENKLIEDHFVGRHLINSGAWGWAEGPRINFYNNKIGKGKGKGKDN